MLIALKALVRCFGRLSALLFLKLRRHAEIDIRRVAGPIHSGEARL